MFQFSSDFLTSKTTWACVLAILTAVAGYLSGTLDGHAAVAAAMYALIKMFERDAHGKVMDEVNHLTYTMKEQNGTLKSNGTGE